MTATQAGKRPLHRKTQRARVRKANSRSPKVTEKALFDLEIDLALRVFETLNTPRSLACYLLVKYHEWQQYLDLQRPDSSSETFKDDYLSTELLSKSPSLPCSTLKQRTARAHERFLEAEQMCSDTNRRFRSYFRDPVSHLEEVHTILAVRHILSEALGPLSEARLGLIAQNCRYGPGATSDVKGRDVLLSKKYAAKKPGCTPTLAPFIKSLYGVDSVTLIDNSSVRFVPKNAKTERTIAVEPQMNGFVQLGIASLLRSTMRRVGLHPDDNSYNRLAAKHAHIHGYATIDLSMASDTVSYEVVKELFPVDWFWLLGLARTSKAKMPDGEVILLEKFSAMGNGYTWELESLIFWAICKHVCGDSVVLVFGDDIVVENQYAESLCKVLTLFGFRMNVEKSFWQGNFRESCGADYCNGRNVRPFYLRGDTRKAITIERQATIYCNLLFRYSVGDDDYPDPRFKRVWRWLSNQTGERKKYHIPWDGPLDGGIIVATDVATQTWRYDRSLHCWSYSFLRHAPLLSKETDYEGALCAFLHMRRSRVSESLFSEEFERSRVSRDYMVNTATSPITRWVGAWL